MANKTYPSWQPRHEAVHQYTLEYPAARYREVAKATDYSVWYISRIVNTPEFRRRYTAHLRAACDQAALRMLLGANR